MKPHEEVGIDHIGGENFEIKQRRCTLKYPTMEMTHENCVGEHSHDKLPTIDGVHIKDKS